MDKTPESDQDASNMDIFEETHIKALDVFGQACQDEGLNTAIAIVEHPQTGRPVIFVRGHIYDVTVQTVAVANDLKQEILRKIK